MNSRMEAGYFGRLRRWVERGWIQDVPEAIAACEFECRKPECPAGEWEKCERRLRAVARDRA